MKLQGCGLNTSLTRMCHSHMLTSWPTGGNQSQYFRMIHRHKLYNERSMKVTGKAALMTLKPHVPGADKCLLLKFAFFRSKNNNYAKFSHSFTLEWAKNVALCKRNHNRRLSTTLFYNQLLATPLKNMKYEMTSLPDRRSRKVPLQLLRQRRHSN